MQVLITDVTNLSQGKLCVAGWDTIQGRMVRPRFRGEEWRFDAGRNFPVVGAVVDFNPLENQDPDRDFPHRRDDVFVERQWTIIRQVEEGEIPREARGSVSDAFANVFDGAAIVASSGTSFINPGTQCASLGAIEVTTNSMSFEKDEYDALRCTISDQDRVYRCKVTSKRLHDKFVSASHSLMEIEAMRQSAASAHIRLGLAGAWVPRDGWHDGGRDERCYIQVNEVFFF